MAQVAYWIIETADDWVSDPAITGAQIKDGKLADGTAALLNGSEAIASQTTQTITEQTAQELTAGTAYKVAWTVYDSTLDEYATPVVGDFTTYAREEVSITFAITVNDSVVRKVGLSANYTDGITVNDSDIPTSNLVALLQNNGASESSFIALQQIIAAISNGIISNESWVKQLSLYSQTTEGAQAAAEWVAETVGAITAAISEGSISATEFILAATAYASLANNINVDSIFSSASAVFESLLNSTQVEDTFNSILTLYILYQDALQVGDTWAKVLGILTSLTEGTISQDSWIGDILGAATGLLLESIVSQDSITSIAASYAIIVENLTASDNLIGRSNINVFIGTPGVEQENIFANSVFTNIFSTIALLENSITAGVTFIGEESVGDQFLTFIIQVNDLFNGLVISYAELLSATRIGDIFTGFEYQPVTTCPVVLRVVVSDPIIEIKLSNLQTLYHIVDTPIIKVTSIDFITSTVDSSC